MNTTPGEHLLLPQPKFLVNLTVFIIHPTSFSSASSLCVLSLIPKLKEIEKTWEWIKITKKLLICIIIYLIKTEDKSHSFTFLG